MPEARGVGSGGGDRVRTAEVIASLCLATDLGMALPFEHGLRGTQLATALARRLGAGDAVVRDTYYLSLLMYSGCTTDADTMSDQFPGGLTRSFLPVMHGSPRDAFGGLVGAVAEPDRPAPARVARTVRHLPRALRSASSHQRAICEVGGMLAERLGVPQSVQQLFADLTERWDGKGRLRGTAGDAIPLPIRIAHVAADANVQRLLHGAEAALGTVQERAGHAFDPEIVGCLVQHAPELLADDAGGGSSWDATLAAEPEPLRVLEGGAIDHALAAMGAFADLLSPHFAGHADGVARLAAAAAEQCGLDTGAVAAVRRAALVHDLGRVGVAPRVWNTAGPLTADDREQVRLHAYCTERVLARSPFLSPLGRIAGAHHERLDGSGYHRSATAAALTPGARLLAAADMYHAMTEPRPHRPPLAAEAAARQLGQEVSDGRLDADATGAVLAVAGHPVPPLERPAGLTEREAQVIGLLARGQQTKQIARALGISAKTADRHIQHAYAKIGVSTRAAATLFAMQEGLLAWGELPMVRSRGLIVRSSRSGRAGRPDDQIWG